MIRRRVAAMLAAAAMVSAVLSSGSAAKANPGFVQGTIVMAANQDGTLEAFASDGNNALWHRRQTSTGATTWTGWYSMDGSMRALASETNANGLIELIGLDNDGNIYQRRQTAANATSWTAWQQLDGLLTSVALARNADGRLQMFGVNDQGNVFSRWQTSASAATWSPWQKYDGLMRAVAAETNKDGRIELFAIDAAGDLFHAYQLVANTTGQTAADWTTWLAVPFAGRGAEALASARDGEGRLHLFVIDSQQHIFGAHQDSPGSDSWSKWETFDGTLKSIAAESDSDGFVTLIGVYVVGMVFEKHQERTPGDWSVWQQLPGPLAGPAPDPNDCAWGSSTCNPCVNDVIGSVTTTLEDHGDAAGFYVGGGMPDPDYVNTGNNHLQGVQRLPIDNGRWLAVSYDDKDRGPGGIGFVHMGSRAPLEFGGRLRSNRLGPALAEVQAPPTDDVGMAKIDSGRLDLWHAGGMQALGTYLAVPFEGSASSSEVRIYDVANPLAPALRYTLVRKGQSNAGNVGWVRRADGTYLLMVGGYDSTPLDFYTSTAIDGPYTYAGTSSAFVPAFQNSNIVTECGTRDLYIVGGYQTGWLDDYKDKLGVYRLDLSSTGAVTLTNEARRHMYCTMTLSIRQCDFLAAGGTYVSNAHELFFYNTEHDNTGPDRSVKMMEFRPVDPNPGTCATNLNNAWVELFQDSNFGGRHIIIDYADRGLENYSDYHQVEDFNDRASSVRWCLPAGASYELRADTGFGGTGRILADSGSDADLGSSPGIIGWNDRISSSRY